MAMSFAATGVLANRITGTATLPMAMALAAAGELRALDFDVWWSMDESSGTRSDSTGNGYDLSYNPYGVGSAAAKVDMGLNLGAGQAILCGGPSRPDHSTSWSWFGWLKHEATLGVQSTRILQFGGPGTTLYFGFSETGWKAEFYMGGYEVVSWATPPTAGSWYFWTLTYDAALALVKLWLNGVQVASGTLTFPVLDSGDSGDLQVGFGGGVAWIADEVGRSPAVLGPTEINWLYNSGAGRSFSEV